MAPKNKKLKKIVIFSHSCEGTTGWDDELYSYLKENNHKNIVLIQFPFFFSKSKEIKVRIWENGEEKIHRSSVKFYKPEPISFAKDYFYAIYYGIRFCRDADLIVCLNNLLALSGLSLRAISVAKKIAYTIVDYTPVRYYNKLLNILYYWMDKKACYEADFVWPLNKRMIEGRAEDNKIDLAKIKNWQEVPFGNHSDEYSQVAYQNFDRNKIVYFGGVLKSKGAELFVPIMKELIARGHKEFQFHVIGGGDTDYLKSEIKKAKLDKYFTIYGRMPDQEEINKILLGCGVAIAPYYPEDKNSYSYYADPGKIKVYLGCGLPVVVTDVPPIAKILNTERCGLIAKYDAIDFAEKIVKLIGKEKEYLSYRNNAIKLGREFCWYNIFNNLINQTSKNIQ